MISASQRPDGWWSIEFEFAYNGMTFTDAIVLSPIDYINTRDVDIIAMQEQRFSAWVSSITQYVEP